MNLSRKWLREFVSVDANDKDFAESMTLSGSKVELMADIICIMLSLEENIPGFADECADFMRKAGDLQKMNDDADT